LHPKILITLGIAVLAVTAGGCGRPGPPQSSQPTSGRITIAPSSPPSALATGHSPAATHRTPRPAAGGTELLRVLAEPQAGIGPVYQLMNSARSSVDLSMYELADPVAEEDLAADAARGVAVRVILDQHLERSANAPAYRYLATHGVHVRWGPAGTIYHQKTLTVDDATSVIMTGNLVTSDYPGTRDFAVFDSGKADVAAIVATFDADFAGRPITPPDGTDLVWSPANAQASILGVIDRATRALAVEAEEMDDPAITSALAAAARRGVHVTITMTADPQWDQAFAELTQAGAHVRLYPDNGSALYIHAKAIVADAGLPGQQVLVGSQNFSVASLDYNRELGILTRNPVIVAAIAAALASDYAGAAPFRQPAPAAKGSGAWCTATATVYNSARDENNVYLHSNQPDQDATASAGGYSHSYYTDSSGYALIYLNGPPPGARITVTVGDATCTTSD
jgi:cardiolipin synthase A/B